MFQDVPGRNRVTGSSSGHPPARYGPYGPKEGTDQPTRGLVRPLPCLASPREGKGGGLAPPAFPSHGRKERGAPPSPAFPRTPNKERGRGLGGTPSRIPPTWAPPLAAPPSLPPIYMWGGGATQGHNIVLAVCGAPVHRLLPRSYFCSA